MVTLGILVHRLCLTRPAFAIHPPPRFQSFKTGGPLIDSRTLTCDPAVTARFRSAADVVFPCHSSLNAFNSFFSRQIRDYPDSCTSEFRCAGIWIIARSCGKAGTRVSRDRQNRASTGPFVTTPTAHHPPPFSPAPNLPSRLSPRRQAERRGRGVGRGRLGCAVQSCRSQAGRTSRLRKTKAGYRRRCLRPRPTP